MSAVVYCGGVYLRALQIKRRIGRPPNLSPRGAKEKALWAGWALVVLGWTLGPLLTERFGSCALFRLWTPLEKPLFSYAGLAMVAAGLVGTVWCHASLGNTWRLGVRGEEKTPLVTNGVYRRLRHPIYAFQVLILAGVWLLWPTPFLLGLVVLHRILVAVKIRDEENHLERLHGSLYKEYVQRTGSLWPKV